MELPERNSLSEDSSDSSSEKAADKSASVPSIEIMPLKDIGRHSDISGVLKENKTMMETDHTNLKVPGTEESKQQ